MKTRAPRPKAPTGVWLIARSPTDIPYPCRCWLGKPCSHLCPCHGRTDMDNLPKHCCTKRKDHLRP